MSTQEFDVERARLVLANYNDVYRDEWTVRAADLLGPALDALSAARKERDEAEKRADQAEGRALEEAAQYCDLRGFGDVALGIRSFKSRPPIPPTLASLAERVKAIEERMEYTGNE